MEASLPVREEPPVEPGPGGDDNLLETVNISKIFGGLVAVEDVNFAIPKKSIVSIIGPNGAGKTTFFNMLTGLYRPSTGVIVFDGADITSMRPDRIVQRGMARTFQNIRLFGTMTALENVMVAEHPASATGLFGAIVRPPRTGREEVAVRDKAQQILNYVGLRPALADDRAVNEAHRD